jgi:hypothetical protein
MLAVLPALTIRRTAGTYGDPVAELGPRIAHSLSEDLVPSISIFGIEPALGLSPVAEMKDAHDPRLDVDAFPASPHDAQRAHVFVVSEDIVLTRRER